MTSELIELDASVWMYYIDDYARSHSWVGSSKLFTCVCPDCKGGRKKQKRLSGGFYSTNSANHTACVLLRSDGKGYRFTCRACGLNFSSVWKLLEETSCGSAGDAFKEYFADSSFKHKVFSETFETCLPIKNQVPYEDRKPRKKKTFKEKQDIKSAALQIKMDGKSKS